MSNLYIHLDIYKGNYYVIQILDLIDLSEMLYLEIYVSKVYIQIICIT